VLIPAYNAEATIGAAIESVLAQDDEVIGLPDGRVDAELDVGPAAVLAWGEVEDPGQIVIGYQAHEHGGSL